MSQSILATNPDGYQIVKLPLRISTSRVGGIRINKVFVVNETNSWQRHVFKIKDIYCDYDNVSNLNLTNSFNLEYSQMYPDNYSHTDFHIEKSFDLIDDDFFNFSVTFEPLSEITVTGVFECELRIDYQTINNLGFDFFILQIVGECREQRVQVIDGVNTSSPNYILKVHGSSYNNEFIRLG
jgi:hypothetical protein